MSCTSQFSPFYLWISNQSKNQFANELGFTSDKYMYFIAILIQEISMDPYRFNVQWVLNHTVTCYMIGLLGCLILRISIFWLLVTLSKGYIATPFFKLTFVREKVWISTSNSYLSKCTEDCNTSTMYMNVTCITWHF